ncbi:MAG: acyl-CoA dehydrogenase, partial [Mycolicibacterium aromaticivorans]|nr:acyl-CoA dehydrogenase [Mycolicibacterium aromaticivorans]
MWDFETDPEYQKKLDWVEELMQDKLAPLDFAPLAPYEKTNPQVLRVL